jgi:hypothetical protein
MINYPLEDIELIKITVSYEIKKGGKGSNDFNNLKELKIWLDKHPNMAKKLGYEKTK